MSEIELQQPEQQPEEEQQQQAEEEQQQQAEEEPQPVAAADDGENAEAPQEDEDGAGAPADGDNAEPAEGEEPEEAEQQPPPEPRDELDFPDEPTARELDLQARIAQLRADIENRKQRHAELLEEKANRQEHLRDVRSNIETMEERLEITTLSVQHLRQLEDRARIVAAKLQRCEEFMDRVRTWVRGPYTEECEMKRRASRRAVEVEIMTRIQELQHTRAAKLREMSNMDAKITENRTHLRQQHQREPARVHRGFEEVLTPQAKAYERCTSPRQAALEQDDESMKIQEIVMEAESELNDILSSLKAAQKQRSQLSSELAQHTTGTRKVKAELEGAIRRKELAATHDQRKCMELENKSVALVSTLEVQIKALKLLHYGATGGPTTTKLLKSGGGVSPSRAGRTTTGTK